VNKHIEEYILKAKNNFKKNWILAIETLNIALKKYPENKDLLVAFGDAYRFKGNIKRALEYYRIAHNLDVSDDRVLFKLGCLCLEANRPENGKIYLSQISKPNDITLYKLSLCHIQTRSYNKATKYLEKLMDLQPEFKPGYLLLVETNIGCKNLEKAFNYLKKDEEVFGKSPQNQFLWGYYYLQKKNYLASFCSFKEAEKLGFNFFSNFKFFALVAKKIALYDVAEKYYFRALRFLPFDSVIYESLLGIYLKQGKILPAKNLVKKISSIVPMSKRLVELIKTVNLEFKIKRPPE